MSTEGTGTGQQDQHDAATQKDGTVAPSGSGVGLGAGEPNTFEPEEGTAAQGGSEPSDDQVGTAEETEDVDDTPVDTTEPS